VKTSISGGGFMKNLLPVLGMGLVLLLLAGILFSPTTNVQALPEYSAQIGEPCSSCHASPSGGGQRTPRGQAWVGAGKPGSVPDLLAALDLLGVKLDVDLNDYLAQPGEISPAAPLELNPDMSQTIHEWLKDYEGN
jgi:hypothetical protein